MILSPSSTLAARSAEVSPRKNGTNAAWMLALSFLSFLQLVIFLAAGLAADAGPAMTKALSAMVRRQQNRDASHVPPWVCRVFARTVTPPNLTRASGSGIPPGAALGPAQAGGAPQMPACTVSVSMSSMAVRSTRSVPVAWK